MGTQLTDIWQVWVGLLVTLLCRLCCGGIAKVHKSCSKVSHVSKIVVPLNTVLYVAAATLRNKFDLSVAAILSETTSSSHQQRDMNGRLAASLAVACAPIHTADVNRDA